MGWNSGFVTVARFDEKLTPSQYFVIDDYIRWKGDKWTQAHYPVFKDFYKAQNYVGKPISTENLYQPTEEDVVFYTNSKPKDIVWWCSIGRKLDEFIHPLLTQVDSTENYVVTPEFIKKAMAWVDDELDDNELVEAKVLRASKVKGEEEIFFPIDGLELEDDYGNTVRISCEYDSLFVSKNKYFDPSYYQALKEFKFALDNISKVDLEKNWVFYYRSY